MSTAARGDGGAALRTAWTGGRLVGLGYWQCYARPTHRPRGMPASGGIRSRRQALDDGP
ncbi:hypothetical protein OG389_30685 [Streptomyces sp. NBC_00435]|uniref:hypothetical protein n=1 Tax=Streptomyces sp. NBC_00435 TaxID=2903649 RepID=UPI002E1D2E96